MIQCSEEKLAQIVEEVIDKKVGSIVEEKVNEQLSKHLYENREKMYNALSEEKERLRMEMQSFISQDINTMIKSVLTETIGKAVDVVKNKMEILKEKAEMDMEENKEQREKQMKILQALDNAFNLIMKKIDEREFSKDDIDEEKLDKIDKAVEELKKYINKDNHELYEALGNNIVYIAELLGDSTGTIRGDILKLQKSISADLASVNSNISSVSRQVGSIDRNMISRW
ncbi:MULTISPECIES: hypothetical protein [unclassified Lebetimonas]|uniref:hypothetical protein n=1 Tax=unclassified Lebetimonas TaxID=2648158 RepID=UPI0004633119|nr:MULTISPECIES: hypothetical protein [unclassified Lebetimonas]